MLSILIATGISVRPGPLSGQNQKKCVCVCRPRHAYTFTTIFHFYIYLCKMKTMSSHQYFSFQSNFPFTPLSVKPGSHYPYILTIWSVPLVYHQLATSTATPPPCGHAPVLAQALTAHAEPPLLSLLTLWPALGNDSSPKLQTRVLRCPTPWLRDWIVQEGEGLNWLLNKGFH